MMISIPSVLLHTEFFFLVKFSTLFVEKQVFLGMSAFLNLC